MICFFSLIFPCSWIGILHHFWCKFLPFQFFFQLWKSKYKIDTLEVQRQSFSSYSFGLWKVMALWRHFTRCQEIHFLDNVFEAISKNIKKSTSFDSVPHFGNHPRLTSNCTQPESLEMSSRTIFKRHRWCEQKKQIWYQWEIRKMDVVPRTRETFQVFSIQTSLRPPSPRGLPAPPPRQQREKDWDIYVVIFWGKLSKCDHLWRLSKTNIIFLAYTFVNCRNIFSVLTWLENVPLLLSQAIETLWQQAVILNNPESQGLPAKSKIQRQKNLALLPHHAFLVSLRKPN